MKKTILVLCAMFLMLSLAVMSTPFSGKKGAKADSKTPAKCWQKLEKYEPVPVGGGESTRIDDKVWRSPYDVVSEDLRRVFDDDEDETSVCAAYEEVLNATCEPPEKLQCNWTLPEGEKRFKKLEWKPLEPKEYWGLIQDIALSGLNEKFRVGQWEKFKEPEYKKELEQGTLRLAVTTVDINQDGKEEQVVHLNRTPDCATRGVFGVMDPETKRMDWQRNKVFFHVNALSYYGAEIMLYEGKAFVFKIEDMYQPKTGYPTKEVILHELFSSGNECHFNYLKGGTKQ